MVVSKTAHDWPWDRAPRAFAHPRSERELNSDMKSIDESSFLKTEEEHRARAIIRAAGYPAAPFSFQLYANRSPQPGVLPEGMYVRVSVEWPRVLPARYAFDCGRWIEAFKRDLLNRRFDRRAEPRS